MPVRGALLIFIVSLIEGNCHLPVMFIFLAGRFMGNVVSRAGVMLDFAFGMRFQIVVPSRVVFAPKTGCHQRDLLVIEKADERHRTRLIGLCSKGSELNNIPPKDFRGSEFSSGQS